MNDFEELDLVGAAAAIASKKISALELTEWSLQRMHTLGKQYNAVFRIDQEQALERARTLDNTQLSSGVTGPLHGVPLAHKDLIEVASLENHAGSKILRGHIAEKNAWVIDALNTAGQVNVGSLHMCEFAMSPTGFNGHYGHGLNPWNPEYTCGGSSSGSGIAVAARIVFGSLGSDTGGSIRHPSAMCGVTGIKPTARRVSIEGVFPLSKTLDCVGPIAQTARDCARLLTHISRPNPDDTWCTSTPAQDYERALTGDLKGLRVGVPQSYYRENLDPEVALALETSLDVLKQRGAVLVDVAVPDMARLNSMAGIVMTSQAAALHREWIETRPNDYADQVRARIEPGFTHSAVSYVDAMRFQKALTDEYVNTCLKDCDVIHIPVFTVQTPTIASTIQGDTQNILKSIAHLTYANRAINYLGLPAMSVPAGFSTTGMPLAFQLVAKHFDEATLLRTADAYQQDTHWHRQRPST
jgi:aspartyl-tRNA(Asn)/glutamyl-tRNA(Gln) amidotransferase subunit A